MSWCSFCSGRSGLLLLVLMVALFRLEIPGHAATRQANSTLAFPQDPFQFALVDAFPGLVFDGAVAFATPPGETNRLFIVERRGIIQLIPNLANPTKTIFLDISSRVNPSGEGGLLGLAFHPGYASNRLFFVYYTLNTTTPAGTGLHDRLARFETSPANPARALPDSEAPLITQFDEADNHNAGGLHFGPDGYLYLSLGDEGGGGDQFGNSQTITRDFFSGILRLDVDRRPGSLAPNPHPAISTNYAIPPDNPFVGATSFNGAAVNPASVRTEFWAVGMRNPWRFSFDPETGRLYCGDVGEGQREEINLVTRGGNYGWRYREGKIAFNGTPPAGTALLEPLLDYPHGGGSFQGNAVVGGLVYRGTRIPSLYGDYVFGDHSSGNIWALRHEGTNVTSFRRITSMAGLAAFGVDPRNGDLLMSVPWGPTPIQRLVFSTQSASLPPRLSDTGAFQDLTTLQPNPGIVPYDINTPFWSDYAVKRRWFSIPTLNQFMGFSSNGNWSFPTGMVWVKHFDLEMTNGVPSSSRRLETRFLIKNASGAYGLTYRWNAAQTDATLVGEDGLEETLSIRDGNSVRAQTWRYPSRSECLACHTTVGGHALGFNTAQLNRDRIENGSPVNQILWLGQTGYFSNSVPGIASLPAYAHATNASASLELRARSYLGANCAHCHQPGGTGRGYWDARLSTSLAQSGLLNGPLIDDFGDPDNRVIHPGSPELSMIYQRVSQLGARHMPPLGTSELDRTAIQLLSDWIANDLVGARIDSIRMEAGNVVTITFAGIPGRTYRVEASSNLTAWQSIGAVQAAAGGTGQFNGPVNPGVRFYRFAWP